jgi:hypothetical protein
MGVHMPKGRVIVVALAALVAAVCAASAIAGITVYRNNFSSKTESKELRHVEGKHCDRSWRKKAKSALIKADRGPQVCGYSPPVMSDNAGPDHTFQAEMKLLKDTPKRVRDSVYLSVSVRSSKKTGYQLRVYPSKHRFKLVRQPSGGGKGFPATGGSKAIKGTNKPNVLSLKAKGSQVIARVNGKKLAKVVDTNAAQVNGRRVEVALGYGKKKSKPAFATVDSLKLQVPSP